MIWHKLPRSYSQIMKKPYDKWVDRESEAIQESSLIKAHFLREKCTNFLIWMREGEAKPNFIRKLESISKPDKSTLV